MNRKRVLVIGLLGLFMISMFAGVASASPFSDWFSTNFGGDGTFMPGLFGEEDGQPGLAKLLLITLVVLLVYAISASLPFLGGAGKDGVRWAFSIVVGVLSFMLVKADTIQVILTNYEALGIALTSIIPLVILMTFVWELKKTHGPVASVIERPLFILFAGYLTWKWVLAAGIDGIGDPNPMAWLYIVTAVLSIFWGLSAKKIFARYMAALRKARALGSRHATRSAARAVKNLQAFEESTAEKKLSDEELDASVNGNK